MSVDPDSAAPVGSAVPTDPVAPSTGPSFHPTLPTVLHSSAAHPNFYIGEIGGGLTADSTYFDSAAAAAVGPEYTFTVWALEGYNSQFRPSGDSAEQWGAAQANAYINAWLNKQDAFGTTLFGDIESGNYGWSGTTESQNQSVLKGFLNTIHTTTQGSFVAGVYLSQDTWNTFFGSSYSSPVLIVVWAAGSPYCPGTCRSGHRFH